MRISTVLAIPVAIVVSLCCASRAEEQGTVELFNGKDLSGWTYHLADPQVKMQDVWSVQDGLLTCTGKPAGYLITEKSDFQDYRLTVEWRWHTGKAGNNGVLVHCSTPGALGVWCKSIEVQLANGNAGDFWVIGTELDVPNEAERVKGRRHLNLTENSEKPVGGVELYGGRLPGQRDQGPGEWRTSQSRHERQRDKRKPSHCNRKAPRFSSAAYA